MKIYTLIAFLTMVEMISPMVYSQDAPVTLAGTAINPAVGSEISIPVTVTGFSAIGALALKLSYDTAVVAVSSANINPILPGCTADWMTEPGKIYITWVGGFPKTIPDFSHLVDIAFTVHNSGSTLLQWVDDGSSCEYKRFSASGSYVILNDSPPSSFYINGLITTQGAPVTIAPVITNASVGPLTIDIRTKGFQDIGAISLTLKYDPSVLTFQENYTPNDTLALNGSFMVSSYPTPDGLNNLALSWIVNPGPGVPLITLSDSSILVSFYFYFDQAFGTSPLTWFDNGSTCEYAATSLDALWDAPTPTFYKNGMVTFQREAPRTFIPDVPGNAPIVCVPVNVTGFSDIGGLVLTIDYDTAVLTYQDLAGSNLPSTWSVSTSQVFPGRVEISGSGPGFSLPGDSGTLFSACFLYQGGNSLLSWHLANGGCQYIDALNGFPLFDLPTSEYYHNGFVRAWLQAGFAADDTTPAKNQIVTFTDQTQGVPSTWFWSFDPPGPVIFWNGTTANSQYPEVIFVAGGYYSVSLQVTNPDGSSSATRYDYIHAGIPGLWNGVQSSGWDQSGNWDNLSVPDGTVDVIIPGGCPFWPVIDGDLILGIQCKTVTLQTPGSKLTVTGNLIIN